MNYAFVWETHRGTKMLVSLGQNVHIVANPWQLPSFLTIVTKLDKWTLSLFLFCKFSVKDPTAVS